MAPHSSVIAWRISWTQEPGGLRSTVHRVAKSWTRLKRLSTHIYTHTFEDYTMCSICIYVYYMYNIYFHNIAISALLGVMEIIKIKVGIIVIYSMRNKHKHR